MLRQWAETKFNLPWTHEAFQQLSLFELLIMFWEDHYRKNPIEAKRGVDGTVTFSNTGDALIDKWERELAMGIEPDLLEGASQKLRQDDKAGRKKATRQNNVAHSEGLKDGFSDNYELQGLPVLGRR